ncbi:MAG: malectin domain-containing carbohydrate-binding protein, partial [Verrucomicrobiota bacterium]
GRFSGWLPAYQHQADMFYAESPDMLPIEGAVDPWIYASGYVNEKHLEFPMLDPERHKQATYTIRLHFAEPETIEIGERVFDVMIQGQQLLEDFDIAKAADGVKKAHAIEFSGIEVTDKLRIELKAKSDKSPILNGFEARMESR